MSQLHQPRVRGNNWRILAPPDLGQWTPTLPVSVVIPAYNAHKTLPLTLASLAAQTYPEHLLEVVVVDDGSQPPVSLPEIRPARTRVVRTETSWGCAHACSVGASAAEGEVIHWLDADMIVYRDHVEAQMRWHHIIDYAVVLGHKMFVDPAGGQGGLPSASQVRDDTLRGASAGLFEDLEALPHDWVEAFQERTAELTSAGPTAWTVHVGATASVTAELYRSAGGMDSALKLGEDMDLGYRLSQVGAVFIPDRQAQSWHLGPSNVMCRREEVNRYNAPFLTDRISQLRYRRLSPGRQYSVPYLQVVVDLSSASWEEARASLDGLLANVDVDLVCVCVGPWSSLDDSRRSPLSDPLRDLRMIQGSYRGESRVQLVDVAPESAFPAAFGVDLPVGCRPEPTSLGRLLKRMESQALGHVSVLMPDSAVVRIERTAAAARTERLLQDQEVREDVMDEVYGGWWCDGPDVGFRWWDDTEPVQPLREPGPLELTKADLAAAQARIAVLEEALRELLLATAGQGAATRRRGFGGLRRGREGAGGA